MMNMKTLLNLAIGLALLSLTALNASGQAKKPTLMVFPGETWCNANGYVTTVNNQGRTAKIPDYERAVTEDFDLVNVITKIGELMADRGFPMKDLNAEIRQYRNNEVEDELTQSSTSGAGIAETPLERLLRQARADIRVEVTWKVNSVGPKKSVTYNLRGIDAYSDKQIAAATGTGAQSFSAETPVLLEEAVLDKMDGFLAQLQSHFDDMAANGRETTLRIQVFDNGSGISLEKDYNGLELSEIIEEWVDDNTVQHRFSLSDASENTMYFEQVRIPLYNERGRAMDARMFARQLQKHLAASPYNIISKIKTGGGLGKATLVLGEK